MDHSAHGSMKNAASCETWCELQDTLSTDFSNAHCGLGYYPGPRLSEGRIHACRGGSPPCGRTGSSLPPTQSLRARPFRKRPAEDARDWEWRFVLSNGSLELGPAVLDAGNGRRNADEAGSPRSPAKKKICRPQIRRDDPLNLSI